MFRISIIRKFEFRYVMNIVFMGTPEFAVPSLEQLAHSSHHIKTVVTGVDKRRGRGSNLSPTAVKAKALELGLPVIEIEDLNSISFARELEALHADLFVVVAFRILPASVLEIPAKGAVNLHASLLPKYRGAAPIHRAIINGEERTGCTVFMLNETVDTGEIIGQSSTRIDKNETTGDLYERLKKIGAELLVKSVNEIDNGTFTSIPQDEKKASPAPKLYTEDCRIDFYHSAEKVHNKIRGLSPFPAGWAELDDLKFNIYHSKMNRYDSLEPGELQIKDGKLIAGCEKGSVILEKVQLEGKRKMSGKDFMNGYHGTGVLH